jgi:hypothetical protein
MKRQAHNSGMSPIRLWIIATLMLCLPLQGMAAIALPMGMSHEAVVAMNMQDMESMSDHCKQHEQPDAQPEKSTSACDQCFSCHLSVAQALTPFATDFHPVSAGVLAFAVSGNKVAILTFPFFRPPISA